MPFVYGLTASIGNARMVIHTEVEEGKTTVIEKYVRVNNVNEVPVTITLDPRGDLIGITEIEDKTFTLQPGESKDANFKVTLKYGGNYEGQIGVGFQSLEGGSGVGLSSTIIIIAGGPQDPNKKQATNETTGEIPEETLPGEQETPVEEAPNETEEPAVTVGSKKPIIEKEEAVKDGKKASPLVGIFIVLAIVGVGVVISLVIMMVLRRK